jgi:hypothetical protein
VEDGEIGRGEVCLGWLLSLRVDRGGSLGRGSIRFLLLREVRSSCAECQVYGYFDARVKIGKLPILDALLNLGHSLYLNVQEYVGHCSFCS